MKTPCVHICAGGTIDVLPVPKPNDVVIGVDGGALALLQAGIPIDLAVGDFDTAGEEGLARLLEAGVTLDRYRPEKDATDTEIALHKAISLQPKKIVFYGALGGRLDHTLSHLHMLLTCHRAGVFATIKSLHNEVMLLSETFPRNRVEARGFTYVSLLPMGAAVTGITLENFLYPLTDRTIELGSTLGISNELVGEWGEVSITSGLLLVILSKDVEK